MKLFVTFVRFGIHSPKSYNWYIVLHNNCDRRDDNRTGKRKSLRCRWMETKGERKEKKRKEKSQQL